MSLAVAILIGVGGIAHAQSPLTLEEAVRLALTRNERAAIADLEIEVAEASIYRARGAFLPIVQLSANDTYRPRNDDPKNTAQATLALSQPIFEPTAFPLYSQAKHAHAARRAQRTDARRRLAFDAANAFMDTLLGEQVVQAAQRKLETAKSNLASTDAQMKAQLVSSNDVTRAQISLATATRDLAVGTGNLRAAYVELEHVLATKVTAVTPPTSLLEAGKQPQSAADDLIASSISRRADLEANKELAAAARAFAREPRMRYLPSFELGAQVSAVTPSDGNTIDALIAISARWTLFDAGSRSADARARDAQVKIADLETSTLVRSIDADVRSAVVVLESRQQALAAAGSARDAARKGADEAAILYRQGLAKAIELLDANDSRFIAEVNFATTEFDVATAYLSLRLAMGLDPTEVKP